MTQEEDMDIRDTQEYRLIKSVYGDRRAARSNLPLMNHIDEGLRILEQTGASEAAMRAFCLHPVFQADADLARHAHLAQACDPYVLMLAMEYRNTANACLSHRVIGGPDDIALSPLPEVNQMLVADKIQNFKDFMLHHHGTHPRSEALHGYFRNWFEKLGIPMEVFAALEKEEKPALRKPAPPRP